VPPELQQAIDESLAHRSFAVREASASVWVEGYGEVAGETTQVVVCRSNDQVIGVVVTSILDIVEEELSVRSALDTGGHLGSAVVAGHVTELVDIERAVCAVEPALLAAAAATF